MIEQQLFSLILYKNVNPCDFKLCHERKGILYNLFAQKKAFISKMAEIYPDLLDDSKSKSIKDLLGYPKNQIAEMLGVDTNSESIQLLFYLARHGYIDENYEDVISYMYDNQLDAYDYLFLKKILSFSYNDFNQKIRKIETILEKIPDESYWRSPGILNYDLLEYLLKNKENDKINLFTKVMLKNDCENGSKLFFINMKKKDGITPLLNSIAHNISNYAMNNLFDDSNLDVFIQFLHAMNQPDAKSLKNKIKTLWNEKERLFYDDESIEKLLDNYTALKRFNLNFLKLSKVSKATLLWKIVDRRLYEINSENLKIILKLRPDEHLDLMTCQKNEDVYSYIMSNLNTYIQNIVEKDKDSLDWDVAFFIMHPKTDIKHINPLMGKLKKRISDLEEFIEKIKYEIPNVKADIIEKLFEKNKIEPTQKNIYYAVDKFHINKNNLITNSQPVQTFIKYLEAPGLNRKELRKQINNIGPKEFWRIMDENISESIVKNIQKHNLASFFIQKCLVDKKLGLHPKTFVLFSKNNFTEIYEKYLTKIPLTSISPYIFINGDDNGTIFWTELQLKTIVNRMNLFNRFESYLNTVIHYDKRAALLLLDKFFDYLDTPTRISAYEIVTNQKIPISEGKEDFKAAKQIIQRELNEKKQIP
ncbi:MAG: hypothetical protein J6U20_09070 [Fibrobacter sp.]|nr:hypothetical protein [Fibrobacter sp.]